MKADRRWCARGHARHEEESGFTLVELLVSIVILGIIGSVMGLVTFAGIRSQKNVQNLLEGSGGSQLLGVWLPADVQSADPALISVATAAGSNCSDSASGPSISYLAHLRWVGQGVTYYSAYYRNGSTLVRSYCTSVASVAVPAVVVSNIRSAVSTLDATTKRVTLTIRTVGDEAERDWTVVAKPRSGTTGSVPGAPPIPAPGECVGSLTFVPATAKWKANGANFRLDEAVTVRMTVVGNCTASPTWTMTIGLTPVSSGSMSLMSGVWTGTIAKNTALPSPGAGSYQVTVNVGSTAVATGSLQVNP